jgi:WD40 repeat protein
MVLACKGHTDQVFGVAFHPDGSCLASASKDRTVRIWDSATAETLRVLPGHERGATRVAFSPDGTLLASGGEDDEVRLWDAGTGSLILTCTGHRSVIWSVAFSPDGRRLVSGGDEVVKLWDLSAARVLKTFAGNGGPCLGLALSPDGGRVAAACSGIQDQQGLRPGEVRVWRIETGELVFTAAGEDPRNSTMRSVCFDPTGRCLASGCTDAVVRICEVGSE